MAPDLFLCHLQLNLRSRDVRRDLSDCMAMHRTVMSGFPNGLSSTGTGRAEAAVLYRLETGHEGLPFVLVQSGVAPDWSSLPPGYLIPGSAAGTKNIAPLLACLFSGRRLRFRLLANPTRKIATKTSADGFRSNGTRVPLHGEDECIAWLARKSQTAGFRIHEVRGAPHIPAVQAAPQPLSSGWKNLSPDRRTRLTFAGVLFDGRLEVVDTQVFLGAIRAGIGAGKAYGHGLLSVAPAVD